MASRTSQRSSRLTSRKDQAISDTSEDLEPQDEQEEDLTLDTAEEDEDDVQAVVPVEERSVTQAGATSVSRRNADRLLLWVPRGYLRDSIAELLKVTWPSRQETINLTILVLSIAAAFAIVYGLLDIVFFDGLTAIINHTK